MSAAEEEDGTAPVGAGHLGVDRKMLEALTCPLTQGTLELDSARGELISRRAHLAYPIRNGIPIMLPDEARALE